MSHRPPKVAGMTHDVHAEPAEEPDPVAEEAAATPDAISTLGIEPTGLGSALRATLSDLDIEPVGLRAALDDFGTAIGTLDIGSALDTAATNSLSNFTATQLWTPPTAGLVDAGPGLGQVWAEYATDLHLWLVRPKVKAVGIPAAIFLFGAWFLSFKMKHPEIADELKDLLFGVFFMVMSGWLASRGGRD